MEQKQIKHTARIAGRGIRVETLKRLLDTLEPQFLDEQLSRRLQNRSMSADGLRLLAAAMTILMTDYGGTTPSSTAEAIAVYAPRVYRAWGPERVLAVCQEIQCAEIPEQSAVFQEMYRQFNTQYFGGRLPDYKILVVYDVWYWETERCGYPPCDPSVPDADGFIDFSGRQIFIRFLAHQTTCPAMEEILLHEMAHAATSGEHDAKWLEEMERLKGLGAPVPTIELCDEEMTDPTSWNVFGTTGSVGS